MHCMIVNEKARNTFIPKLQYCGIVPKDGTNTHHELHRNNFDLAYEVYTYLVKE